MVNCKKEVPEIIQITTQFHLFNEIELCTSVCWMKLLYAKVIFGWSQILWTSMPVYEFLCCRFAPSILKLVWFLAFFGLTSLTRHDSIVQPQLSMCILSNLPIISVSCGVRPRTKQELKPNKEEGVAEKKSIIIYIILCCLYSDHYGTQLPGHTHTAW